MRIQSLIIGAMTLSFVTACKKDEPTKASLQIDGLSNSTFSSEASISIKTGLVAYYPFSGNANDVSGNKLNGTVNGAILTTDRFGNAGKAYAFSDGTTINVPHDAKLGFLPTGAFSVSVWVFRTGTQDVMHVIGKRPYHTGTFNWQLAYQNSTQYTTSVADGFSFGFGGGAYYAVFSQTPLSNGKWTHVAATYNSGNWKIYQDGVFKGSFSAMDTDSDTDCEMTIGNSGGYEPFFGLIDEVRIYNRVLTSKEVYFLSSH